MGIFQRGTPGPGTLCSCLFFEDNILYGSSRTFLGGFFVPSQAVAMDPRDSVVDCCVFFVGSTPKTHPKASKTKGFSSEQYKLEEFSFDMLGSFKRPNGIGQPPGYLACRA